MNTINNTDTKSSGRILYAGDTSLRTAAAYLGGVLTHFGHEFDYVDSSTPLAGVLASAQHSLFILSDYPSDKLEVEDFQSILDTVRSGGALFMIGGWDTFHGLMGKYDTSPLAQALPVIISDSDDRQNVATPCVVEKLTEHPVTSGLPFDRPPTIGGYNRVTAKPQAECLLAARRLLIGNSSPGEYSFAVGDSDPLLVVDSWGQGRVAAFMSDVAPHWVGGLVDWGDSRVQAQAPNAGDVEVGNFYAELFNRIVNWSLGRI